MNKCENCIEWEYFEGYGYGCFYKKTMTPIDADKCDSFVDKKVNFNEEFIYKKRGFREITSDEELIKYAKKVTYGWSDAGHRHKFIDFYLSNYALSEPYASLTRKEFNRLKELQKIAQEEYKAEQAKYKYELYEGRPLTEAEIRMFLDRHIQRIEEQWGEDNFYTEQAREHKDKVLSKFRAGEVVPVDSYEYNAAYGNGIGSYDRILYSDGTIKDGCYGYLD